MRDTKEDINRMQNARKKRKRHERSEKKRAMIIPEATKEAKEMVKWKTRSRSSGVGVPERSLGVGAPECDVKKWKTRSIKYGKHGV